MDIITVLHNIAVLFLLLGVGYVARKRKLFDAAADGLMTRLVLNITMPALLITAMVGGPAEMPRRILFYVMLMILLAFAAKGVLGFLSALALGMPREKRGTVAAMVMFGNVGFMGFPLVYALLGAEGLFIASIFNVVFNLLVFSLGIKLVAGGGGKLSPWLFLNAPMVSSVIAILLFLLGIRLPYTIAVTLGHLGDMTIPLAMILLGSTLAGMDWKELFQDWRAYGIAVVKLLAAPLVVYLALVRVVADPVLLHVVVLLSAMPVGTSLPMLCIRYGGDQELAGRGIFISTLLSLATIPLLAPLFLT